MTSPRAFVLLALLAACSKAGDREPVVTGVLAGADAARGLEIIAGLNRAGVPLRAAGTFPSPAQAPAEVRALLVPVTSLPVAGFACGWVASAGQGTLELALQEQVPSLQALDGAVVAVSALRSLELTTLVAAAHAAGLAVELLADNGAVPAEGRIGVVVAGTDAVARHWFSAFRIDALPASSELSGGSRLAIGPRAEHVLCTRDGVSVNLAPSPGALAPLPVELRVALGNPLPGKSTTPSSEVALAFGRRGEGTDELGEPDSIATDSLGRILVGDDVQRRVHVYDAEGTFLSSFGGGGSDLGRFGKAVAGIAVGPSGEIFCGDPGNGRVLVFSPDYKPLRAISGQLTSPSGVVVDGKNRLYVSDDTRNDVSIYNAADGHFLGRLGAGAGTGPGQFHSPGVMTVGPTGELYVADEDNHRVQVFDETGKYLRTVGAERIVGDVEGLAFDAQGRLWVVDEDTALVRAFSPEGDYLGYVGAGIGPEQGQMVSPEGVTFHAASGRLYVADELNYRVQAFRSDKLRAPEAVTGTTGSRMLVLGRLGDPHKTIPQYQPFVDYMAAALAAGGEKWTGRVRAFPSMRELVAAVKAREVDIIFESSLAAAYLLDQTGARPIASGSRGGHLTYRGVVFVNKDSPITSLDQLRGKVVAMEDSSSTSGFLVPSALLLEKGIPMVELKDPGEKPPGDQVGYVFAEEEVTIISWVFSGRVAAGGISTLDLDELGDVGANFRIVETSPPIAYYIIAVAPQVDQTIADRLRDALFQLPRSAKGAEILNATRAKEFYPMDAPGVPGAFAEARRLLGVVDRLLGG